MICNGEDSFGVGWFYTCIRNTAMTLPQPNKCWILNANTYMDNCILADEQFICKIIILFTPVIKIPHK